MKALCVSAAPIPRRSHGQQLKYTVTLWHGRYTVKMQSGEWPSHLDLWNWGKCAGALWESEINERVQQSYNEIHHFYVQTVWAHTHKWTKTSTTFSFIFSPWILLSCICFSAALLFIIFTWQSKYDYGSCFPWWHWPLLHDIICSTKMKSLFRILRS